MILVLGGCREAEQGRILEYQKGTYLGKPDTSFSEASRREQHQRILYQGGSRSVALVGGRATSPSNVGSLGGPGMTRAAREAARGRVLSQGVK